MGGRTRTANAQGKEPLRHKTLYCGVDLHSNNAMYVITDQEDRQLFRKRLPNVLSVVRGHWKPFRERLQVVAVESTYHWYWLVDGLLAHGYPVVLANPAKMERYNGIKEANDLTDAGVGVILALTIMLETGPMERFKKVGDYTSYCRCVRAVHRSNGKLKDQHNRRHGNPSLAWAFVEAVHHAIRSCPAAKRFYDRNLAQHNGALATKALASKWSKAAYYLIRRQENFDLTRVFG